MKEIDPGHQFELLSLDGNKEEPPQLLTFVKREGEGYPANVGHHSGTTCQSVLRALCARVRYLQGQIPCFENENVLSHLRKALVQLENRAQKRHGSFKTVTEDQAEFMDMCPQCGHVICPHCNGTGRIE